MERQTYEAEIFPTFCTVHNKEELYKKDKWKKFLWRKEVC